MLGDKWETWLPHIGSILSRDDVIVYVGQRGRGGGGEGGEGSPIERKSLRPYLVVSAPSAGVSNIREAKNVLLQVRNDERMRKIHLFSGGPFPPSVYQGRHQRHSRDKIYQAFPLRFAYCKQSKKKKWTVGRPGNEATSSPQTQWAGPNTPR